MKDFKEYTDEEITEANKPLLVISGIQCDNPKCDFIDKSVKYEDYPKWLDKECPKCGENLLTKKDYDNCKTMMKIVDGAQSVVKFMFRG